VLLNIVLSLLLIGPLSFGGLALANTVATTLEALALLWLLRGRMGGVDGRALAPAALKLGAAAAIMGVCLYLFLALVRGQSIWLIAAGALLVGGGAYLLSVLALRAGDFASITRILLRRS